MNDGRSRRRCGLVPRDSTIVRHLLEHRSGLAPGASPWRHGSPGAARRQALQASLREQPGRTVECGDLGMIVLGSIPEAAPDGPSPSKRGCLVDG